MIRPVSLLAAAALLASASSTPVAGAQDPRAASATALRVGDRLPALAGEFLTGRDAQLPDAASGRVALVALGFTYASRYPVEAWMDWFKRRYGTRPSLTFFEVPVIGGMARMGRWFIDSGMRRGTPKALHEHVITVYGDSGTWKRRFGLKDDRAAVLVVLDQAGTIRWLHEGMFDEARAADVEQVIDRLLGATGQ